MTPHAMWNLLTMRVWIECVDDDGSRNSLIVPTSYSSRRSREDESSEFVAATYNRMSGMHSEYSTLVDYLEWIADLPWNKTVADQLKISGARAQLAHGRRCGHTDEHPEPADAAAGLDGDDQRPARWPDAPGVRVACAGARRYRGDPRTPRAVSQGACARPAHGCDDLRSPLAASALAAAVTC